MISQIEAFTSTKHIYSNNTFEALVKFVLHNGLNGMSVHGCFLDYLASCKIRPKTFVSIDYPFCQNDSNVRADILQSYINHFGPYITGFNLLPMTKHISSGDISKIVDDMEKLSNICRQNKKSSRLFINLATYEDYKIIHRLVDNIQSIDIDELIIGSSISKPENLEDILKIIVDLRKNINIPCNFFGKLSNINDLNKLFPMEFKSIIIPFTILLRIFGA